MTSKMKLCDSLLGLSQSHLTLIDNGHFIHKDAVSSFESLKVASQSRGFDLSIFSSFRSFEDQLRIWNDKAIGRRDILDDRGEKKDYNSLSEEELIFSILRWSALPGMSRHHFGSDIDVIDQLAIPHPDYNIQLIPEEVNEDGIFGKMNLWLDDIIEKDESFHFFRPYKEDLGGVAPEKWHLSFYPVANSLLQSLNLKIFQDLLNSDLYKSLEGIDIVKKHAEMIFRNYIMRISQPPWIMGN